MEIEYTQHGAYQQKERHIEEEKIIQTIAYPDNVFQSRDNVQIAQKLFDDRLLRVVYKKEGTTYVIITAYYTRAARYGVDSRDNHL